MILSFTPYHPFFKMADISENDGILPHYTKQRSNTNQLGEILQYQGHGPIQTHPTLSIEQRLLLAHGQAIREMVLNAKYTEFITKRSATSHATNGHKMS